MNLLVPSLALVAAAALLAGCTAAGPELPPSPSVTPPASAAAGPSPSATQSPSVTAPPPSRPAIGEISAKDFVKLVMAAEFTSYSTQVSMSGSQAEAELAMGVAADVAQSDPENLTMRMAMSILDMEVETIIVKGVAFARTPAVGPDWYKVPPEEVSGALVLGKMGMVREWVDEVESHIKKVEILGDELVDEVPTTQYLVTYDAKALGTIMGSGLGGSSAMLATDTFSSDVWLDAEGRSRRFGMTLALEDSELTVQGRAGNFGATFDIKAPEEYSESP